MAESASAESDLRRAAAEAHAHASSAVSGDAYVPSPSTSRVRVQEADFDISAELAALRGSDAAVGAVAVFIGTVRDRNPGIDGGPIAAMTLEHYPGMTEAAIDAMIDDAHRRFEIRAARVIHRVGMLQPSDQIMMVAVTSSHRAAAFQACEFLMDYLKTQAPFWKKESTPSGARWVDARVADDAAMARWGIVSTNAGDAPSTGHAPDAKPF